MCVNLRRFEEHAIRNVMSSSHDCTQTNAREDVRVVTLTRVKRFAVHLDFAKRTSTGENASTLGVPKETR